METRKLYYEDCNCREFTASVLSCEKTDKGWEITLDATAFYPEGGGQAADTGTLGNVRVLDTREREEQVIHLCDGPLDAGTVVAGTIDWEARFDRMQQHSGEHILSGLIHEKFGCHNTGFHMGTGLMEVDFDGMMTMEDLRELELRANQAVWADLPIRCWYPSEAELPTVGYRTKRDLPWPVRIVEIPGYDKCACCGIHVATTGQIGLIKVLSCVKFHQGVRLLMVCGRRALDYMSRVYDQNKLVSQAFSAKILETGAAAVRMNEALAAEKLRANTLETKLLAHIAAGYTGRGNAVHFQPGLSPNALRELAEAMARACGGRAAVFSGEDGNYNVCMVHPGGDLKALGAAMNQALNGRGGGKPGYFQGSVKATRAEIEGFMTNAE